LDKFEKWASHHGFDVTKHKTGFYLCKSTQLAKEAYLLGKGDNK